MEVVELMVRLHCKACEKSVRRALCKIKGVRSVEIDRRSNKMRVLVSGDLEKKAVVKAIWKTGRRAEILEAPSATVTATTKKAWGFRGDVEEKAFMKAIWKNGRRRRAEISEAPTATTSTTTTTKAWGFRVGIFSTSLSCFSKV